jgi:hypothetical protein
MMPKIPGIVRLPCFMGQARFGGYSEKTGLMEDNSPAPGRDDIVQMSLNKQIEMNPLQSHR